MILTFLKEMCVNKYWYLFYLIKSNNLDLFVKNIKKYNNIKDIINNNNQTLLEYAFELESTNFIQFLISFDKEYVKNCINRHENHNILWYLLISSKCMDIIELLINNFDTDVINNLFKHFIDELESDPKFNLSLLAKHNNLELFKLLISMDRCSMQRCIYNTNINKQNILHISCLYNNINFIKLLISLDENIVKNLNRKDYYGYVPIYYAYYKKNESIITLLSFYLYSKNNKIEPTDNEFLQCILCMTNKKNYKIDCGHLYCIECISKIDSKKCPECRKSFIKWDLVYI